jgi:hypothetical protein
VAERKDRRGLRGAVETVATRPARFLTAAAERVRLERAGRRGRARKSEQWQQDAWEFFDAIGEVKQATYFLANVVSNIRLFVAIQPDPESEPVPAEPNDVGAFEAELALNRLRTGSAYGGLGGLLAEFVVNLKVAAECYLVGTQEVAGDPTAEDAEKRMGSPERWDVKSIDEVEYKDKKWLVREEPGKDGQELPEDAFVCRVWQRHPRFSQLADCALRGVLAECEELLILSRGIRAAGVSRFATSGVFLKVPDELSFASADPNEDVGEDGDSFFRQLMAVVTTAIKDEGSALAAAPMMIRGKAEHLAAFDKLVIDRPFDATAAAQRKELIERLGHSLDIPVEQLTGLANVNHWTAWQVDGASWSRYGQPTARIIVEALTEGFLWPHLEEMGIASDLARRLIVWFDPADAIVDPDISKSADEAHDRFTISDEAHRRYKGFSEDDAPAIEEIEERIRRRTRGPAAGDSIGAPNDGEPPDGPEARIRSNGRGQLTAASRAPLGQRLTSIDRALRTRLEEMSDGALRAALKTAGNRIRSKAQKSRDMRAAVERVAAHQVAARLGASLVAALELTEDELLDNAFDDLRPKFDARVKRAQEETRRVLQEELELDDSELDALERQQDEDRAAAWMWFLGAMTALARERLYDPSPGAPPAGEFDAAQEVPARLVREAVARAGGAAGTSPEAPAGGVATGDLVQQVWARHGRVVSGWRWVYGDASSRTRPFPAHEDLDGVELESWSDPQLLVRPEDSWLGVTHYRPADHDWCQCDFEPIGLDVAEADAA